MALLQEDGSVFSLGGLFEPWLGAVVTTALVVAALAVAQRLLRPQGGGRFHGPGPQVAMLGLTLAGLLAILLALPIDPATRGQLLSFLGIVLSAAIALSSTNLLGNALAGLMLRIVRNFKIGDFVRVGEVFGRVSERGLVHTEIQTEDRDLVTLPHLYLVTQPVTVVRASGTIVAATVSLGYDVPRARIEELLVEAALEADLEEPFVQVLDLLDHAVVYRVAGLLREVTQLLSVRSRLRGKVLDALHGVGIEIVSPGFVNMRNHEAGRKFVPRSVLKAKSEEASASPEGIVFDKADQAASIESLRGRLEAMKERAREARECEKQAPEAEREELTASAQALEERAERLEARLEARVAQVRQED